ncbi:hypothetical protein BpHYR1_007418 [Brachionus plicatilis]|uniref:Uncharacterized protein n=1 Tax=Brachionus plicatilis TaxID=10195 RepID=A0A3M7SLX9_BRAPC|nr:hypothetical protein BpHYR1_007418 [Brachionus plicatilis]
MMILKKFKIDTKIKQIMFMKLILKFDHELQFSKNLIRISINAVGDLSLQVVAHLRQNRRKKNLKIKKSKKIFIQEKFFDFEFFFSSLKNELKTNEEKATFFREFLANTFRPNKHFRLYHIIINFIHILIFCYAKNNDREKVLSEKKKIV